MVELVIGTLGKKQVIVDQKEMYNSRSVLSGNFHYKFLISDKVFVIKNDKDDFDIYTGDNCGVSFREMLERNKPERKQVEQPVIKSILPDIHQFSNTSNNRLNNEANKNRTQAKELDILGLDVDNGVNQNKAQNKLNNFNFDAPAKKPSEQNKGRLFDELSTDFFGNKVEDEKVETGFDQFEKNPFDTDDTNVQKSDDWAFKTSKVDNHYEKKSNLRIFDNVPVSKSSKNNQINENLFEEVNDSFKNAKLIENNGEYITAHDNSPYNTNFETMDDFDKQLEQNKTQNKTYVKSPFDIDPEEGLQSLGHGIKKVLKKAQKTLHQAE